MGFTGTLFHAIKDFYALPFHQYKYNYCDWDSKCTNDRDWFLTIAISFLVLLITFAVIFVLGLIGYQLYDTYSWYRHRERCQHCEQWTLWTSSGEYPNCLADHACCDDCDLEHQADAEEKLHCPVPSCNNIIMEKIIDDDLIYDECPSCKRVTLDEGELELFEDRAYRKGYSDGRTSGTISGTAVGIAIS